MIELLEWWNLVFVLPFVFGLFYLLMLAAGVSGDHEAGAEAGAVFDHDAGVDFGHDADFDHGIEHSTELGHADHETNAFIKALSFLGVGRVPISLIMMSFCFLWGFSGWASNQLLKDVLRFPAIFFLPSLGIALVTSVIGTRWLARGISRIMPSTETYATSAQDLVGLTGEALFPINSTFGRARLYDRFRNLQDVSCRITPGEETIPSGSRIVLLRYDTVEKAYIVRPDPLGADRLL